MMLSCSLFSPFSFFALVCVRKNNTTPPPRPPEQTLHPHAALGCWDERDCVSPKRACRKWQVDKVRRNIFINFHYHFIASYLLYVITILKIYFPTTLTLVSQTSASITCFLTLNSSIELIMIWYTDTRHGKREWVVKNWEFLPFFPSNYNATPHDERSSFMLGNFSFFFAPKQLARSFSFYFFSFSSLCNIYCVTFTYFRYLSWVDFFTKILDFYCYFHRQQHPVSYRILPPSLLEICQQSTFRNFSVFSSSPRLFSVSASPDFFGSSFFFFVSHRLPSSSFNLLFLVGCCCCCDCWCRISSFSLTWNSTSRQQQRVERNLLSKGEKKHSSAPYEREHGWIVGV